MVLVMQQLQQFLLLEQAHHQHVAEVNLLADNTISDILIKNAGIGYTVAPTVTIANPSLIQWCW